MRQGRFLPCPFQFGIPDSMLCSPKYRKIIHINRNYLKHRRRWIEQLGNRALWSQNV